MAKKLKVYQTSIGFFDLAIAAPSMKAAAEARSDVQLRNSTSPTSVGFTQITFFASVQWRRLGFRSVEF